MVIWCEQLIHWKSPWCWERLKAGEEASEDKMVGWHHWYNAYDLGQTLGDSQGQGGLACRSPWGLQSHTQLCDWTTEVMTLLNEFDPTALYSVALIATTIPALHMAPWHYNLATSLLKTETLTEYQGLPRWPSGKVIHLAVQKTQEMWVHSLGHEDPLE